MQTWNKEHQTIHGYVCVCVNKEWHTKQTT